jgi:hypothetical protein
MAEYKDDRCDFLCSFYVVFDVLREVLYKQQPAAGSFYTTFCVIIACDSSTN